MLGYVLPGWRSLLRLVTPEAAQECYQALAGRVAAATHHHALRVGKLWGAWAVAQGWLPVNPYATLSPIGEASRGKPQLTLDEARRLYAVCLQEGSEASTAVLCLLLLGLRRGELLALTPRALDDGGRILRVFRGKSRAATRPLAVPEELRTLLVPIAAQSKERLFAHEVSWVQYHVDRLADVARIPIKLCPHGLRGSWATLAVESGAATLEVSKLLGHAGTQVGQRHYIAPGTVDAARVVGISAALKREV